MTLPSICRLPRCAAGPHAQWRPRLPAARHGRVAARAGESPAQGGQGEEQPSLEQLAQELLAKDPVTAAKLQRVGDAARRVMELQVGAGGRRGAGRAGRLTCSRPAVEGYSFENFQARHCTACSAQLLSSSFFTPRYKAEVLIPLPCAGRVGAAGPGAGRGER